jgi:MoaA/NifB/PqqE/SkfB family radical SAM enzyme
MEERPRAIKVGEDLFTFGGKLLSFFPSVGLKLTGSCRLRCPFCCEPNRTQDVASIESFFSITNILNKSGTKRLCLTGGDPLLYPGIGQLLNHTKELGFYNLLLTTDGSLLMKRYNEVVRFLNAVRFSVHALDSQHDDIVKYSGAFRATEDAMDCIANDEIPCFVTTVVTTLNIDAIFDVAEWCVYKKVKKHFLFGLMRSGLGKRFIEQYGDVSPGHIAELVAKLQKKYSSEQIEIIYYDYTNNAECILIYGDGRVVLDPYPNSTSFQLEIGNILADTPEDILNRFLADPRNYEGYCRHLHMHEKI